MNEQVKVIVISGGLVVEEELFADFDSALDYASVKQDEGFRVRIEETEVEDDYVPAL